MPHFWWFRHVSVLKRRNDSQRHLSMLLSERTVQTMYLALVCLCRLEHSASSIIDTWDRNAKFIPFYMVTFLCMCCLGWSNKHGNGDEVLLSSHSCPHGLFGDQLPPILPPGVRLVEAHSLLSTHAGMFTVALSEGLLPSLHPLSTSRWAVGFIFLILQGFMGLEY